MRRTLGRPASPVSIGIAMLVSSSSAPIAGFCTMTLKTGADRSGNTSWGSAVSHTAPTPVPVPTMRMVKSGRAKVARMIPPMRPSVLMVLALAACLLRLGLQEERSLHDDRLTRREPLQDLDLAAEVAPASDLTRFEDPLVTRQENSPALSDTL